MKPAVYIETSVISYYTARPSNNLITLAHQRLTDIWWKKALPKLSPYLSQFVVDEISKGNNEAAKKRLEATSKFLILEATPKVSSLASVYFKALQIPEKARFDAIHMAMATIHGMDYLVSWNCMHIASGRVRNIIDRINSEHEYSTPTICTPEELMEV
jgi:hypothetical protein